MPWLADADSTTVPCHGAHTKATQATPRRSAAAFTPPTDPAVLTGPGNRGRADLVIEARFFLNDALSCFVELGGIAAEDRVGEAT